ncbi:hypothetical protein [Inmirania thermothiophila]|uniref:Nickel/cobalt transporter regulator n=1 Tax=Inmirania thermothiophila TaxID=1750597 RepID=A0A3N1Y1A7_9GAMM|nr:hypothetical protein [Inmirania thermothiophila]ROR32606.1 hypothetical protein EDC57_1812 [Inmirania thermothiophila]
MSRGLAKRIGILAALALPVAAPAGAQAGVVVSRVVVVPAAPVVVYHPPAIRWGHGGLHRHRGRFGGWHRPWPRRVYRAPSVVRRWHRDGGLVLRYRAYDDRGGVRLRIEIAERWRD